MKKLISNKNFIQKTVISIIIVLLLSFAVPIQSKADFGGILLDPLFDLVGTIGDAIVGGLQMFLVNGTMNNSDGDGDLLNAFMVKPDDFVRNEGGKYDEYQHTATDEIEIENGKKADVKIPESKLDSNFLGRSTYYIPVLGYSPEKIFSGLVPALDIDFVNPKDWEEKGYENGAEMNKRSVAYTLHGTIASWYVALRNLAIVGLMLVLVYVGIRIVISSTASDKSKYKQMLQDWLIALCLLFFLHYIMVFTTTIIDEVSKTIAGTNGENNGNNIAVTVEGTEYQFNTDLMGLIRFKMQSPEVLEKLLYLIFYLAMVIYTCLFTFTYLKRVLVMAFLTLISPLVVLTYPIDKLRDGKAQAFDMWLKEYIFNALIQPFHLIIYTIFVGSAINLAAENPIFAIVALAFLTPAEKILRKFFGFEKATTGGALGTFAGIAGGTAAFNMLKGALGGRKGGKGGATGGSKAPRTKASRVEGDVPSLSTLGSGSSGSESSGEAQSGDVRQTGNDDNRQAESGPELTDEASMWENYGNTGSFYGSSGGTSSGAGDSMSAGGPTPADADDGGADSTSAPVPPIREGTGAGSDTSDESTSELSGFHDHGSLSYWDNDQRGMGQWLGDGLAGMPFISDAMYHGRRAFRAVKGTAANYAKGLSEERAWGKAKQDAEIAKLPKPIRNTARTIGNAVAPVAKGVGNVALQTGKAVGKGAVRTGVGLASGAVRAMPGAVLGMAAGIAGDDLGDIWKYTAAGAALTNSALRGSGSSIGSFVSTAYKEGARGSKEGQIAQRQKEYQKSDEVRELYEAEYPDLSKKELKEKIRQGSYYDSLGIGGEDAIKGIKVQEKLRQEIKGRNQGMAEEDADRRAQIIAANAMKKVKDYSAKDLRDEETMKGLRADLAKTCTKQGLSDRDTKETVDLIVKGMKIAKKVDNDL